MNTDFEVEWEMDVLDPVPRHGIEHALLIVNVREYLSPNHNGSAVYYCNTYCCNLSQSLCGFVSDLTSFQLIFFCLYFFRRQPSGHLMSVVI